MHDVCLVGTLRLKDDVTEKDLDAAFKPFLDHYGVDSSNLENEMSLEGKTLYFRFEFQQSSPEVNDVITQLAEALTRLIESHGVIRLLDYDCYHDEDITVFLGRDVEAQNMARAEHGVERMRPYVEPVLGAEQFSGLSAMIVSTCKVAR